MLCKLFEFVAFLLLLSVYFSWVFHTIVKWWSFIGVSVQNSIFCLILIMLPFGWDRFVLWFPTFLIPFPSLSGPFQVRQLQLISLSRLCCVSFFSSLARSNYLSLLSLWFSLSGLPGWQSPFFTRFSLSLSLYIYIYISWWPSLCMNHLVI